LVYGGENDVASVEKSITLAALHSAHLKRSFEILLFQIPSVLLVESRCESAQRESVDQPVSERYSVALGVDKGQQGRPTLARARRRHEDKILSF
jgi:hypothetical protein